MGFDDTWAQADPDAVGNSEDNAPDDGTHDAALIEGRAFTSKGGNDMVVLEWQTVDRQHQWPSLHGFKTQEAANFTKKTCRDLGVAIDDVASLDELDSLLKEHVGEFFEVEVKRNGDYINTYINGGGVKPVADVPADVSPDPVPAGDDGVPF